MTPRQYIEYMEEMIATPGWSIMVEEFTKDIYALQADALEAKTWDDVLRMRGEANKLAEIVNLEEIVATQRVEMEARTPWPRRLHQANCPHCGQAGEQKITPVAFDVSAMGLDAVGFPTFANKWAKRHKSK